MPGEGENLGSEEGPSARPLGVGPRLWVRVRVRVPCASPRKPAHLAPDVSSDGTRSSARTPQRYIRTGRSRGWDCHETTEQTLWVFHFSRLPQGPPVSVSCQIREGRAPVSRLLSCAGSSSAAGACAGRRQGQARRPWRPSMAMSKRVTSCLVWRSLRMCSYVAESRRASSWAGMEFVVRVFSVGAHTRVQACVRASCGAPQTDGVRGKGG